MKLLMITIVSSLFLSYQTSQAQNIENTNNIIHPFLGTWNFIGAVDSLGNEIAYLSGENTYFTQLESGDFFEFGFKKNYPNSVDDPPTAEQLKEIYNKAFLNYGHTDIKNMNTITYTYKYSMNPNYVGRQFTAEYKIIGDTAILIAGGAYLRYIKVNQLVK